MKRKFVTLNKQAMVENIYANRIDRAAQKGFVRLEILTDDDYEKRSLFEYMIIADCYDGIYEHHKNGVVNIIVPASVIFAIENR